MGDPKGFMTVPRKEAGYRPAKERIYDYGEVEQTLNEKDRQLQASRCMDCGIPFCHWGCPVKVKFPNGRMHFTAEEKMKLIIYYTQPIVFRK